MSKSQNPDSKLPKRFQSSKKVLIIDQFMTQFIKIGGIGLIMAVSGIFVFILFQIIPLFQGASVSKLKTTSIMNG
jgi:phosphate transport system permease protein